jgi:hypothetical protein
MDFLGVISGGYLVGKIRKKEKKNNVGHFLKNRNAFSCMYVFHFSERLASFYALLCDQQIRYNFPPGDLHFFKGPCRSSIF